MMLIILLPVFLFVALWLIPGWPRRIARALTMFLLCLVLLPLPLASVAGGWAVRGTLLNPPSYARALDQAGVLEALPVAASELLADMAKGNQLPPNVAEEVKRTVADCLAAAVPPQWLGQRLTEVLTSLLDYLRGTKRTVDAVLDLREPKTRALEVLAASKAPKEMLRQLKSMLNQLPDEISATKPYPINLEAMLSVARQPVRIAGWILPLSLGVAGALALLAMLVSGTGLRGAAGWLGTGALVAGLAVVGGSVYLGFAARDFAAGFRIEGAMRYVPVREAVAGLAGGVLNVLRVGGIGLLVAAVALFVLGWILRRLAVRARPAAGTTPAGLPAAGGSPTPAASVPAAPAPAVATQAAPAQAAPAGTAPSGPPAPGQPPSGATPG